MKGKTIVFLVFLFVLVQSATAANITFSISEQSGVISTVFTLVPSQSYHIGSGGSSSSAPIQEDTPIQEEVDSTPSLVSDPSVIPSQIPTTPETSQEQVGVNQTLTKIKDNNILFAVCFLTILVVLFLSYVYVIGKKAKGR